MKALEMIVSDWEAAKSRHDASRWGGAMAAWTNAAAKAEFENAAALLASTMRETGAWDVNGARAETHLLTLLDKGDRDGAQAMAQAMLRHGAAQQAMRETLSR